MMNKKRQVTSKDEFLIELKDEFGNFESGLKL